MSVGPIQQTSRALGWLATLLVLGSIAVHAQELSPEEQRLAKRLAEIAPSPKSGGSLEARIAALLPTEDEDKWLTIPWRTDLLRARKEAQEQEKPVFLWLMDGHPLACT